MSGKWRKRIKGSADQIGRPFKVKNSSFDLWGGKCSGKSLESTQLETPRHIFSPYLCPQRHLSIGYDSGLCPVCGEKKHKVIEITSVTLDPTENVMWYDDTDSQTDYYHHYRANIATTIEKLRLQGADIVELILATKDEPKYEKRAKRIAKGAGYSIEKRCIPHESQYGMPETRKWIETKYILTRLPMNESEQMKRRLELAKKYDVDPMGGIGKSGSQKKGQMYCRICGRYTDHMWKNCPNRPLGFKGEWYW